MSDDTIVPLTAHELAGWLKRMESEGRMDTDAYRAMRELSALRSANARLVEALTPFAELVGYLDPTAKDHASLFNHGTTYLTYGDFRAARAALSTQPHPEPQEMVRVKASYVKWTADYIDANSDAPDSQHRKEVLKGLRAALSNAPEMMGRTGK